MIDQDLAEDTPARPGEAATHGALSHKQEQALQAVLSYPTLKEAAQAVGIGETTLWRTMKIPEFARRLGEARRESVTHVISRLQQASADAVTILHELMKREDTPPAARITACRTVLDYSFRAAEMEELRAEIEGLKAFLREKQDEEELNSSSYYEA